MSPHLRPDDVSSSWQPHDHVAWFGDGPSGLDAAAVEVFGGALDGAAAFVFVSDDADPARLAGLPERDALLASGRLRLVRTADAYPHRDPTRLLTAFDALLAEVLRAGWTRMLVVADNTSLVVGDRASFTDWLGWELLTARWQAQNPVTGICWFDREALGEARVTELAAVHGRQAGSPVAARFRLLAGADTLRLSGDVDGHAVATLVRLLGLAPHDGDLVLDVADTGYLHHTVFPALDFAPAGVGRVRVTGARDTLRQVWDAVGGAGSRVELV